MSDKAGLPGSQNLAFVEQLYSQYRHDPPSVSSEWRAYFETLQTGEHLNGGLKLGPSFDPGSLFGSPSAHRNGNAAASPGTIAPTLVDAREQGAADLQNRVDKLIRAHRVRGHMMASLDPLGLPRDYPTELDPEFHGLTMQDMDRRFACDTLHPAGPLKLRDILSRLRTTYCRWIGVQFMHMDDLDVRDWLQERMERTQNRLQLSRDEQIRILTRLTDAVIFEEFIRKKFVGAKSFSLEGSESLIPLLDLAIEAAGEQGVEEIVVGMAHRGRLNVLANIIGKSPREIFREFADTDPDLYIGSGDVKYHLGYANDFTTATGKKVHLALCFNPSHLEFVDPVAMGRLRAKMDRCGSPTRPLHPHEKGMVLLIHGDAAFAGEGVVQETLNMSQLPGYAVGGTLHVVVNNQLGFTTSPAEARSSTYATDVAKMLQIPIFHVNGENPEAVAQVVQLALDFRRAFRRDVVIDMYCYRRLGHNEADEPSFTQPVMYKAIQQRKSVRESYLEQLLELKGVTPEEADEISARRRDYLERELTEARSEHFVPSNRLRGVWGGYVGGSEADVAEVVTGLPQERLTSLLQRLTELPPNFHPHPKIKRLLQARSRMATGEEPLDWSSGEALALASLATEGVNIRMSGQDSQRGTFSQRHAVLHDVEGDQIYTPLCHLAPDQAPVQIYNSPLSEVGVLGYEYGYSLDCLAGLVMWEAQFGDFWNAAQVIVDQFIVSAEDKWHHLSGLVLLLPHGYEGMGPEHSSARLERFLALGAEDNIQVAYPTTPAQLFHLLRRQVHRRWRKPLVVMSPKSLLRHLEAVSPLEDFTDGTFKRVIPDALPPRHINRVLLCTGKIYYELDKQREQLKREDVAIIRLEQLYPLHRETLQTALAAYADGTPVFWVQEEPANMGAWSHMKGNFGEKLFDRLPFSGVSRPASASPATGSQRSHLNEQKLVLAEAFGGG